MESSAEENQQHTELVGVNDEKRDCGNKFVMKGEVYPLTRG